jgi:hypothetical protein
MIYEEKANPKSNNKLKAFTLKFFAGFNRSIIFSGLFSIYLPFNLKMITLLLTDLKPIMVDNKILLEICNSIKPLIANYLIIDDYFTLLYH